MALAIAIFVVSLPAIAGERFDRTKVALVGAALVLITQTIDQDDAIASIDFNTIGLLASMMLMVRPDRDDRRLQLAGDPSGPALARSAARGGDLACDDDRVLSAFLDDAYWWALAIGACFGGNATLIAPPRTWRRPAWPRAQAGRPAS
jgi:Na+/H+ antiporter NhaD/arsenite permease-like protein